MEPIPGPRSLPIVGNALSLRNPEGFLRSMEDMADIYGPIYQLTLGGRKTYIVTSAELCNMITSNEADWPKVPPQILSRVPGAQGLFTVESNDPDWGQAHRILTPSFGPLAIGDMFEGMREVAYQMILKWARQPEGHQVLLTDDATRLTLDTIALCAMDYRFNSFYSEKMHPFVDAMFTFLDSNQKLGLQPAVMQKLQPANVKSATESKAILDRIAQEIIDERRANPKDRPDMLNTLLYGKDPKTGQVMRDELIRVQMVTLLIAGHETTSGMISFAFMNMMQNPETYLKAQQEVDEVLGEGTLSLDVVRKLKYLPAVLRETLRLSATAPLITKTLAPGRHEQGVLIFDGKHRLEHGVPVRILLSKTARDRSWYGDDAEEFKPERMLEDNPEFEHNMKAWKPFGSGSRSCIGQPFAWQETLMIMSLILQNFELSFPDGGYKTKVKQTLTLKPDNMYVKVSLRKGLDVAQVEQRLYDRPDQGPKRITPIKRVPTTNLDSDAGPVILYGSNSGTCHSLAQKLASNFAMKLGIAAQVKELDTAVNNVPVGQPMVIITASYEGQPPDNAARFMTWLGGSDAKDFEGVKYAVFGCGHKDWRETYQRIPKIVDRVLGERGASQLVSLGSTDVSKGTILDDFEHWQEDLFKELQSGSSTDATETTIVPDDLAEISVSTRAEQLSNGLALGKVKNVKLLTEPGQPEKRHMEIELPEGMDYEVGDYLSLLPTNPDELVRRIMKHWGFPRDAVITLKTTAFGSLPTNVPLGIHDLLKGYFELSQPISKSNIKDIKQFAKDSNTIAELDKLLQDEAAFTDIITKHYTSAFDLLTRYPDIQLPFQTFLSGLLPLHIRQYSISSSPLLDPRICTISYTVVRHPSKSNDSDHATFAHEGVASTYLSELMPGDTIQLGTKRTATANLACPFRLPSAAIQDSTPLIMYCAGTGLAPFRGFVQQRAIMLESNPSLKLAPALLFVGCRSSTADRIYADELAAWEELGAVSVRYAFSQEPDHELANGCKYVGDRILKDQEEVRKLWEQGARAYMCGSRKVQDSVKDVVGKIFEIVAAEKGWDREFMEAERAKFRGSLTGRAVSDIFD